MGDRSRLPADARRARGARLLLAPHARSSWPRASTPSRAAQLGPAVGRRHPDHAHHPDRRAVGAAAHPRPRARRARRWSNADVFLLTDERPTVLAADTGVRRRRSEPASTSLLDDLRSDTAHGMGARLDVVHLRTTSRPRPASCVTTSRCRPAPTRSPSARWPASSVARPRPTATTAWVRGAARRRAARARRGRRRCSPGGARRECARAGAPVRRVRDRRGGAGARRPARSCWRAAATRHPPARRRARPRSGDRAHRHRPQPLPHGRADPGASAHRGRASWS